MALLNYTTSITATRTAQQIQDILTAHGARAILMEYDQGAVTAISFKVLVTQTELAIRLPVDVQATLRVLKRNRVAPRYCTEEHARNVAWRIIKDWVEAQMAILSTEMVRMEQIFLPYIITEDGKTVYERLMATGFQLPEGKG